ncbi:NAD-dependent epimerase/dehydratase family protein [Sphingomonas sp. 179-A 2A2 NHS]|uniref:NAD-dependent epimerase/dehydratase family protein n=1 Tax=Sphingomonas sp. 179-A 2A2 NHS TaxID=3374290 RepID=UPI0038797D65
MARAAITGITGLAGGHVAPALRAAGHDVVGISRRPSQPGAGGDIRTVPDLADADALTASLRGCDIVFHFADRANRKSYGEADVGTAADVLVAIRTAAARNGIRRIVAISSVYADRPDRPDDRYGRSKRAMEAVAMAPAPGAPAVILRLPPLYGPGAQGAVRHIARAVAKGWPLPFALARAPRRFLSLHALADLCLHLTNLDDATFDRAAGRVLVPVAVANGSLAALSRTLGNGRARLLPVPGIDRLLGGRVPRGQLERDRDALIDAVGWHAPDGIGH